jgi:two-component system sensor histidine kinase CpxA
VVLNVAEDAEFEAQARRCHVRSEISAGSWPVRGDPSLLHSAIENVVRNAIRYTREGTTVEIHLEKTGTAGGEGAVVRVTDCGSGVPADALEKLFQPFYRLDDARGRQTGGVGLGLAITERAVRFHGGHVAATNRPEGGLMVEIHLPLMPGTASPEEQPIAVATDQWPVASGQRE